MSSRTLHSPLCSKHELQNIPRIYVHTSTRHPRRLRLRRRHRSRRRPNTSPRLAPTPRNLLRPHKITAKATPRRRKSATLRLLPRPTRHDRTPTTPHQICANPHQITPRTPRQQRHVQKAQRTRKSAPPTQHQTSNRPPDLLPFPQWTAHHDAHHQRA